MTDTASAIDFIRIFTAAVVILATLSGCANEPEEKLSYTSQAQLCRSGDAPSCITKQGKPIRCFCADKEALRDLLDPDRRF